MRYRSVAIQRRAIVPQTQAAKGLRSNRDASWCIDEVSLAYLQSATRLPGVDNYRNADRSPGKRHRLDAHEGSELTGYNDQGELTWPLQT